jgi:L-aminopeptidase/D-esterase-like protein
MGWLEEHAVGYRTPLAVIPIVPAAVIFDAAAASGHRRPDAAAGRAACDAAREGKFETGRIGAGAGATVGKWAGREFSVKGGLGMGRAEREGLAVSALVVVNALGDVLDEGGAVIAGTRAPNPRFIAPPGGKQAAAAENTVLAVLAVETQLEKSQARFLAARGSDGITRSVRPAHTRYDGDVVFAVAGRGGPPSGSDLDRLGILASEAVAAAIRDGVRG